METLGVWLHQAREARGNTVEEAAAVTHIRPRLLAALEAGDFAAFPGGDVQARGFLRIYARYLGLSPDEALSRYDTEVHGLEVVRPGTPVATRPMSSARPGMPVATRPMSSARPGMPGEARSTSPARPGAPVTARLASPGQSAAGPAVRQPPRSFAPTPEPRRMSLEGLMVVGLVLAVLLAVVAGAGYVLSRRAGERAARPAVTATPAPVEVLLPSPSSAALRSPVGTPALSANPQGGVTLMLEATEHVWARVTADGQTMFAGMLATGQIEAWSAQEVIAVDTGNGAGLAVTVNGQPQGTMCGRAQVCTRRWGPTGEISAP